MYTSRHSIEFVNAFCCALLHVFFTMNSICRVHHTRGRFTSYFIVFWQDLVFREKSGFLVYIIQLNPSFDYPSYLCGRSCV